MNNEELLLEKLDPELKRIYKAMRKLFELGGTGSIEIHFLRKKIKIKDGLYIKPGFSDEDDYLKEVQK